jgi:hypothetical protein
MSQATESSKADAKCTTGCCARALRLRVHLTGEAKEFNHISASNVPAVRAKKRREIPRPDASALAARLILTLLSSQKLYNVAVTRA